MVAAAMAEEAMEAAVKEEKRILARSLHSQCRSRKAQLLHTDRDETPARRLGKHRCCCTERRTPLCSAWAAVKGRAAMAEVATAVVAKAAS